MRLKNLLLLTAVFSIFACAKDTSNSEDALDIIKIEDSDNTGTTCLEVANYIFNEKNGLVNIEFEDAVFDPNWKLESISGITYMIWQGDQYLSNPGTGLATYNIAISKAGTYRFLWKSAVKTGANGTEHNDTWLRFNDASDFFAEKGTSKVYPKDTGKSPNPEGASKNGWFKIYRSGNNLDFKWQASTYDNNAHDVYVTFDKEGIYTMEISARSSGHGIDKFVLFDESISLQNATSDTSEKSSITCKK